MKHLIGIDAGFVSTGLSSFEVGEGKFKFKGCMTISTSKSDKKKQVRVADDDADRIKVITLGIKDFIETYANDGDIMVAVELPTGGSQGSRANRLMGIVTGAVVAILTMLDIPVEYITPNDVKIAVTGKKTATKDEIMDRIRLVLAQYKSLLPKTKGEFEHIADSIGVCIHIKRHSSLFRVFVG